MNITVFICTYNRGQLISGTLQSIIEKQNKKPDEIVIVNGGGENNCKKTLDYWKTKYDPIIVVDTKNINLAVSRNIGLSYCSGDVILQTDDDARPHANWISSMVKFHKKYPSAGVIGGTVIDGSRLSFLSQVADATTFPRYNSMQSVRSVPGVNSSYKKEAILQVGKYDETLFRGEDVDYNWRVKLNGWEIFYVPTIKVDHIHRSTWRDLFKQHFMYGRAHYLVRLKWPEMYSHYPLKINSLKSVFKWFASWSVIPFLDAKLKARRVNKIINGFDILIILSINISNRIGTAYQQWLKSF